MRKRSAGRTGEEDDWKDEERRGRDEDRENNNMSGLLGNREKLV